MEQRITLADDFYLYDTPGLLWPRIIVAKSGYNLAASGAVGRNAYDEEEVALELINYLRQHYLPLLEARFKLSDTTALQDEDVLTEIGRKRGAVLGGGRINMQKAGELVLTDLRSSIMGRITLETVEEFLAWWEAGMALEAEKAAKKNQRKKGSRDTAPEVEPDEA
jgi:ribosome biogenesis GTPase A